MEKVKFVHLQQRCNYSSIGNKIFQPRRCQVTSRSKDMLLTESMRNMFGLCLPINLHETSWLLRLAALHRRLAALCLAQSVRVCCNIQQAWHSPWKFVLVLGSLYTKLLFNTVYRACHGELLCYMHNMLYSVFLICLNFPHFANHNPILLYRCRIKWFHYLCNPYLTSCIVFLFLCNVM